MAVDDQPAPAGLQRAGAEPVPDVAPDPPLVEITPLEIPRDGVPRVIDDAAGFSALVGAFATGSGPVAVDAERASGHRYGQRAFLVQVRRDGAGTALIDPIGLPDLSALSAALAGTEWVIHAASQDLACLAEVGMVPRLLFDTELGGRLAGYQRVGLATMVEQLLGLALAKEHSAVDWSTRPLPEPWLRYAALDVEVLVDLRDALEVELEAQGKLGWAREEFAALLGAPPPPPRLDPWRRTSGLHRLRDRRRLATLRELWTVRDELARQRDVSPGRVLSDVGLVEAAIAAPTTVQALADLPGFTGRGARRHLRDWLAAVERARSLPEGALPPQHMATDGPPPARLWSEREPEAAARLVACRRAVGAIAEAHRFPVENLLSPDAVRRLAWQPPQPVTLATVESALRGYGARHWQVELTGAALADALH